MKKFWSFSLLVLAIAKGVAGNDAPNDINQAVCMRQDDFEHGTKIISAPGGYKLCEDIEFGPNGPARPGQLPDEDAFDPQHNEKYRENEFGLGFFSALSIAGSDITIYLNGYTIQQSPGHALMQRFFSIIELASSPFIPGAGPAQFVSEDETFVPASNIEIFGPGVIGRSSHHGIHGNDNAFVKIINVEFRDFEVAAVSLNNIDHLEISKCNVVRNRLDVPIVGLFSAARFLRPYGKYLKQQGYELEFKNPNTGMNERKSAAYVYDNLIKSINNVYDDVIYGNGQIDEIKHKEEYHLFHNPFQVVDGPCYAFLVHGRGPAVGGQGGDFNEDDDTATSSNILIRNNHVRDIQCWNNEVPALFGECGNHGCVVNDPRGSIFQTIKTFDKENPYLAMDEDGRYAGNVVSDMQIMVAQAILDEIIPDIPSRQTGPNSINQDIIDWAVKGTVLAPQYVCNGDSMHHVMKGIIVIRVEDTEGFTIEGNTIHDVENLSVEPFSDCADYHIGASIENQGEAQAGNVRAISVAAVRGYAPGNGNLHQSQIIDNNIHSIHSDNANVIVGIDVQGDSDNTDIQGNTVELEDGAQVQDPYESTSRGNHISVRVREAVDGSIFLKNNRFVQQTRILNNNPGNRRRRRRHFNEIKNGKFGIEVPGDSSTQLDTETAVLVSNHAIRRRATRKLNKLHAAHRSGDIEWKVGGCPFAPEYATKHSVPF